MSYDINLSIDPHCEGMSSDSGSRCQPSECVLLNRSIFAGRRARVREARGGLGRLVDWGAEAG